MSVNKMLSHPEQTESYVTIATALAASDLLDLAMGKILALRIPHYYEPVMARALGERFVAHPLFGHYKNAPDIGRVGMAFFETLAGGPELRDTYFGSALSSIRELRRVCSPMLSPMDKLRLDLQEAWEAGADLMHLEGRPMFVGLARVFEDGAEALPHTDVLRRDAPDCASPLQLITQFAANVYLRTAQQGGEVEIWRRKCSDEEIKTLKMPASYGLDRTKLPPCSVQLTPSDGELILFDATNVHAVRPIIEGPRVTVSCFIGYRGADELLAYWS